MSLLSTRALTVRYGGLRALDIVDLDVAEGAFVGLIGPNGAGKTTCIDALSGFVPSEGSIEFGGRRIERLRPHQRARHGLARTFQSIELFDELSVRENLLIPAERFNWATLVRDMFYPARDRAAERSVGDVMSLLKIDTLADASPADLSLGQRKLVTVARALAAGPRLLLLDEPAAGLDSGESLALGQTLRDVVHSGTTILLVDHDMGLVLSVCDYLFVLDFGSVIAQGTPHEIARDERVVGAYLGDEAETGSGTETGAPTEAPVGVEP